MPSNVELRQLRDLRPAQETVIAARRAARGSRISGGGGGSGGGSDGGGGGRGGVGAEEGSNEHDNVSLKSSPEGESERKRGSIFRR